MPPTLKEVAKDAGVAPSTASGILNDRADSWASESTRKRVFDSAQKLGYRPNKFARGLRTGSFQSVGLLVPDLLNPTYAVYARAIEEVLDKSGYSLLVEESKADLKGEKEAVRKLISSQIDGVLCFFMDLEAQKKVFTKELPPGLSAVFFGTSFPKSGIDSVNVDFSQGTSEALEELINLGHRRIAMLHASHPGPGKGTDMRLEVFRKKMGERQLPFPEDDFIVSGHTIEEAHSSFKEYLKRTPKEKRATALFAINDLTAIGAMRAAGEFGLRIPQDLSIIGVDNTPVGQYLPIALTSVSYPTREIAQTATDFLISRMKGESAPQRQASFSTHLVVRESTGPAPKEA